MTGGCRKCSRAGATGSSAHENQVVEAARAPAAMWPVPLVVLGPLFVISAIRRVMAQREVAELGSERVDAETESPDEDEL